MPEIYVLNLDYFGFGRLGFDLGKRVLLGMPAGWGSKTEGIELSALHLIIAKNMKHSKFHSQKIGTIKAMARSTNGRSPPYSSAVEGSPSLVFQSHAQDP